MLGGSALGTAALGTAPRVTTTTVTASAVFSQQHVLYAAPSPLITPVDWGSNPGAWAWLGFGYAFPGGVIQESDLGMRGNLNNAPTQSGTANGGLGVPIATTVGYTYFVRVGALTSVGGPRWRAMVGFSASSAWQNSGSGAYLTTSVAGTGNTLYFGVEMEGPATGWAANSYVDIFSLEVWAIADAPTTTFNGGGTLTAAATQVQPAAASFSGGGTLTASAVRSVPATATMNGGGTLTATAVREQPATATLNGGGTLTASAFRVQAATATMTGGGTFTAAYVTTLPATATLTGGGTLTASAFRVQAATATLSGGGTLTAAAVVVKVATVTLNGGGTLTTASVVVRLGTVVLNGGGTLTVIPIVAATATLSGGHTLTAVASVSYAVLRIVAASLPKAFVAIRDLWGRGGAGRLTVRSTVPTQRWLLLEQPSVAHPLGRVVATSEPVRVDGWDDVIADPEAFTTTSDSWQAEVLRDNGYDLEAVP